LQQLAILNLQIFSMIFYNLTRRMLQLKAWQRCQPISFVAPAAPDHTPYH
jgi:hypothetical protein